MFGAFAVLNWIGLTSVTLGSVQQFVVIASTMTMLSLVSIPLDERWAQRRNQVKTRENG
jgi:hypothetical protein